MTAGSMTRFMMTLASRWTSSSMPSYGQPGELFIRRAPAATVKHSSRHLATCSTSDPLSDHWDPPRREAPRDAGIQCRTGPKSESQEYFCIGLDARGLDYGVYVDEGDPGSQPSRTTTRPRPNSWTSKDSRRCLLTVPEVRGELARADRTARRL